MSNYRKPIAICGVALRLPGGVNSTEKLWEALREGRDTRGIIPESRYHRKGFNQTLGDKGSIQTQYGYFLDQDPGRFDTSLFSLTVEEARRTDPQQRLLLEIVYECFENAGVVDYRGSDIGTYVGTFGEDWLYSQAKEDQHSGGYILGGQADLMLANRVSYEFDLRGPSMVIKTGCSASLVGLHEACRALQFGECSGALVAGSNLILGPTLTAAMSSEGILSPEGSCKSFSAEADGFARGEAVVAVYLQTLERAVQARLPIRAVIANSAVNSNGRSASILQPNMRAQVNLMQKVYTDIDYDPGRTAYVECHGTGTPTGDPIELTAIGEVFGKQGVCIGTMKPNFGHSEGSSGLSSLLKSIVMLEKSMIVPNIKFQTPNPKINFQKHRLHVPEQLTPWPRDRDFRISINSFGIGGSNAHVLVEHVVGYMLKFQKIPRPCFSTAKIFLISAATPTALQTRIRDVDQYAQRNPDSLSSLAYTLASCRQALPSRTFVVQQPGDDFKPAPVLRLSPKNPGITMVFSGQGAQWAQMGLDLYECFPVFKASINAMDRCLKSLKHPPQWSIIDQLRKPPSTSMVHHAEISQPLCTSLQIALVDLLTSAGIKPDAVVGHSSGEIAAAYASGAISRDETMIIAYYRGLVFKDFKANGTMAAIALGRADTNQLLRPGVTIACENSPHSTTISGDGDTILDIIRVAREHNDSIMARKLNVDVAYHSHHLKDLEPLYLSLLKEEIAHEKTPRKEPLIPMYSSADVKERVLTAGDFAPEYWVTNLLSPVRFATAIAQTLRIRSENILLEIGPHSTLSGPLRQICAHQNLPFKYGSSLIRQASGTCSFLTILGRLFQHGLKLDLESFVPYSTVLSDLPAYPWDHATSYWYEARISKSWRNRQSGHHQLLGLRVPSTTDTDPVWRIMLDVESVPWLADHRVNGDVVFPFAGYISMAGEAFRQLGGDGEGYSVCNMAVATAMVINVEEPVEVVTSLHQCTSNCVIESRHMFHFSISSHAKSTWIKHCTGQVDHQSSLLSVNKQVFHCPEKSYQEVGMLHCLV
jgi:acyl transferase domain-containing protein